MCVCFRVGCMAVLCASAGVKGEGSNDLSLRSNTNFVLNNNNGCYFSASFVARASG